MPSIWIFGYGSLVHRPGFPHARRVQGYIPGFKRVWHQGSTDHRGTPEKPGRVVTLEESPESLTYGVAYELCGDEKQQLETLRYLEWREKQYDVRHLVDVYGDPSQDGFAPAPPPVTVTHLLTPPATPALPNSTSTPEITPVTAIASVSDSNVSNGNGMVTSISAAALPDAAAGATTTASMSSADPLMSSDEVAEYAPPADWKRLSASVYLQDPGTDSDLAECGSSSQQGPMDRGASDAANTCLGASAEGGAVPGTRLLLRNALCYIASSNKEHNTNYLGPASLDSIAHQIAHAHGPSGPNWEYVCKLAAALRQMSMEDPELFELEAKVLAIKRSELMSSVGAATRGM